MFNGRDDHNAPVVETGKSRLRRIPWRWRRTLVRLHRWSSVLCGIVVTLWFASGFVMLFHSYPTPTAATKRMLMPALSIDQAVPDWPVTTEVIRWRSFGDELIQTSEENHQEQHRNLSRSHAVEVDEAHFRREVLRVHGVAATDVTLITEPDQWTLYPSMRQQLPAYRVELNDGRFWYVSKHTGQTIQYATWPQRVWAYLGPIPHWVYPRVLVQYRQAWRYLILMIASIGLVTTTAGLLIGLRSLRRYRSPFTSGVLRLHHWLGLTFGLVTWTWLFSGVLSLQPFDWSSGTDVAPVRGNFVRTLPAQTQLT